MSEANNEFQRQFDELMADVPTEPMPPVRPEAVKAEQPAVSADLERTAIEGPAYHPTLDRNLKRPLRTINLSQPDHMIVDMAEEELAVRDEEIYYHGNEVVRVFQDSPATDGCVMPAGTPQISPVGLYNLLDRLPACAKFESPVRGKPEHTQFAHCPERVARMFLARGQWRFLRNLGGGVSGSPVLRPDGSIWQTPGWDSRTGVLFRLAADFPTMPAVVTRCMAVAAAAELLEVSCDFPFEAKHHESAWAAGVLTPLARSAYTGPSPLFLVNANIRAAGKTLLNNATGQIVLGRAMPTSGYVFDAVEMGKRITAVAQQGDQVYHLDNVIGQFGDAALLRAITCENWSERILGKTWQPTFPMRLCWYATGNNTTIGSEMARRIVHIRLNALDERPEDRTNFKHPNLLCWVQENRPRLLMAGLTLLVGFIQAGRPKAKVANFASFEGWSDLVRQACIWAGLADPCAGKEQLMEQADSSNEWIGELPQAWTAMTPARDPISTAKVIERVYAQDLNGRLSIEDVAVRLRLAFESMLDLRSGEIPNAKKLGTGLKGLHEVPKNGLMLVQRMDRHTKTSKWQICKAPSQTTIS